VTTQQIQSRYISTRNTVHTHTVCSALSFDLALYAARKRPPPTPNNMFLRKLRAKKDEEKRDGALLWMD